MRRLCAAAVAGALGAITCAPGAGAPPPAGAPEGMAWVPGGEFTMGSADPRAWATERPAHRVRVDGFCMDVAEVTNAQFAAFVEATGYVTLAQRPVDWEELKKQVPPGTPKPPEEMLAPWSLVFFVPSQPTGTEDMSRWWAWTSGADWSHPEGPGSTLEGRMNHPVTHVSFEDARAYAAWAGKRLPTEAQWEFAARGGLEGAQFVWGDAAPTEEEPRCNIWQGEFPWQNTLADGFLRTAPARSYGANGYGLYGMAGNVWEWCADNYRADEYPRRLQANGDALVVNPPGPEDCWDPNEDIENVPKKVIRGGSFLCLVSFCESYRPRARRGQAPDTGMSHLGFRCVMDAEK